MSVTWSQVQEARQKLARESGAVVREWGGRLPVALAYANTYYVGMSSLALQVMYRAFNNHPDVVCERVFWDEAAAGQELIALESQRPVTDFAVWAFTISYEMDYFNLVTMLHQAGLPLFAADRGDDFPLVIGGGPALSANPEPVAPFFDAIVIGEGEDVVEPLVDALRQHAGDRTALLAALDTLPGFYVPQRVPVAANRDGSGPATAPQRRIERLWTRDLTKLPTVSSLLTDDTEFSNLFLMEIARGCGRGCRFCLAGYVYRPPREVPLDVLLAWAREGLKQREKIGLVSAAVSDHSQIDELAIRLREMGAKLSVSSMRVDPISVPLVKAMAASGTQTLTIAPEAGSARLRGVINKTQTAEQMLAAVDLAESLKFPQLKLYFMVGHATETDADITELIAFVAEVRRRFKRRLAMNATPYVPKPHTPFQWEPMTPAAVMAARQNRLKKELARLQVAVRFDSPAWAEVQGILARGDRRLAAALVNMVGQKLTPARWQRALQEAGLEPDDYLAGFPQGRPLPWDVLDSNVSDAYYTYELRLAERNATSGGCAPATEGCLKCQACDPAWAFRNQSEMLDKLRIPLLPLTA